MRPPVKLDSPEWTDEVFERFLISEIIQAGQQRRVALFGSSVLVHNVVLIERGPLSWASFVNHCDFLSAKSSSDGKKSE